MAGLGPNFNKDAPIVLGALDRGVCTWQEARTALRECGFPLGEDQEASEQLSIPVVVPDPDEPTSAPFDQEEEIT